MVFHHRAHLTSRVRRGFIAVDGKMLRHGIEPVQAVSCSDPQDSFAIDQKVADRVVADARWITTRVAEQFAATGGLVESTESLPRGPYPQGSLPVLAEAEYVAGNSAPRDGVSRAMPPRGITPVKCAGRADPQRSLAIFEYHVDKPLAKICTIAGIERQALERRRSWREEGGLRRTESDPDIVLAILEQRGDSIFRETVRVRWIVAITNETRIFAIKSEQAVRQGTHP